VIVVVGTPAWRPTEPAGPAGRACAVALAAAAHGARVELVGRAGDDAVGDALLVALSASGVGHAAVLRDPARPTPVVPSPEPGDVATSPLEDDGAAASAGVLDALATGPRLEAADVALAMRYLDPTGVLVVTDDVPVDALAAAVEAGRFAGMRLVALLAPGARSPGGVPAGLPPDATVLAAPDGDADGGAFEAMVGAYAAALDLGATPEEAFASATAGAGWEALAPAD
jgi:hypothetical protein